MLRKVALLLIGVVIIACYAVPYLFVGQIADWTGSFLFWCLAGLAIILLNAAAMAAFTEDDE
ncbi:hypothetical protein [Sulfitobacter dubius]|uniref:Uncharacterized protein n=1 Tax=Sulfitobacter dubius TaxID=218673 RepID=A0ABY3ZQW7_9RHOB|nr:hypothetical protein [Sulfitobacter dubius]UOA17016.1 hypothetical protein DSM109990_03908 [Sulfitobacter dubius]